MRKKRLRNLLGFALEKKKKSFSLICYLFTCLLFIYLYLFTHIVVSVTKVLFKCINANWSKHNTIISRCHTFIYNLLIFRRILISINFSIFYIIFISWYFFDKSNNFSIILYFLYIFLYFLEILFLFFCSSKTKQSDQI